MQSPKSVLLHLDGSARCMQRIRVARHVAETFDAEVTAFYGVTPPFMRYPFAMEGGPAAVSIMSDLAEDARNKAHDIFLTASAGAPRLSWSESTSDALSAFARRALYADLMILGQHDARDPAAGELPADFVTRLLIDTGRPALVLPYAGTPAPIGRIALVAWKETREAARAVSAALPWLCGAEEVHVVCHGDEPEAPLQALDSYLKARGVTARLHRGGPEQAGVGESLLSQAADLGADLLVMGCYGHSRAREWALGGATRSILQSMTVPVLLMH
jgi:nucleotide-binding universal stress UspA family protein